MTRFQILAPDILGVAARLCLSLGLLGTGCATSRQPANGPAAGTDSVVQRAYDPSRALLKLQQIAPDPPPPQPAKEGVEELSARSRRRLRRAQELYHDHRFTEAGLELEKALRHDPNHPLVHRDLALALRAAGNIRGVRSHLKKSLELNDDDIVTHYLYGRLAFDDRLNQEAIKHFRIGLKASNASTQPAFEALCHFYLAKALNREGYLIASIDQYRKYEGVVADLTPEARVDPELEPLLQMNHGRAGGPISVAYEKLGRYGQAADALAQSIRDRQPDPGTREHLARLLAKTGRFEEALAQARLLFNDSDRAINLLVELHQRAGHPEAVIQDIQQLYERNTDNTALLMAYVDALQRFNHPAEAQGVLLEAARRYPARSEINWRLMDLFARAEKWQEALEIVADALRADPQVYHTAATKIRALGDSPKALTTLLGTPDQPAQPGGEKASAYLLGVLAESAGRPEQAERLLRQAVKLQPDFAPARVELATILLSRFQWQPTIDLVSTDPEKLAHDSRLERLCGQAYAGLDDFKNAEEHLNAALRLNRTDSAAMVALAETYLLAGETRRAQRQYEAILESNPLHEASREALVKIYLQDKDRREDAAAQVAELRRLSASPHRIARCVALLQLESSDNERATLLQMSPPSRQQGHEGSRWDKYRQILSDAIRQHGPNADTYVAIAESHLMQFHPEQARDVLKHALALEPQNADALERLVLTYEESLQYDRSIEVLKDLLGRHPHRRAWIDHLWRVLMIDHRFNEAYELARKQLQRPDLAEADRMKQRARAIEALGRAKRHDQRIALIEGWYQRDQSNAQVLQWLIEAYVTADRHNDAIEQASRWYEREPHNTDARQGLWWALMQAKRYDQAEQLLLDSLEIDPDDVNLQSQMILLLAIADRYSDALELVDNLAVRLGDERQLRDLKRRVLVVARRYDDVVKLLASWLRELRMDQQNPNLGLIHELQSRLAVNLLRSHQYEDAISKLKKWIDETPNDRVRFAYLRTLSQCYQNRGDQANAIEALQQAYHLLDKDVGVNNDLGYSLADAGLRIAQAEHMIRYALSQDPENGAFLDSMGWVLYKKGEFEQAKRWLEKAIDTPGGNDPVVHEHLGDTNWRLGSVKQALAEWHKSLDLVNEQSDDSDRPDLKELVNRIRAKLAAQANAQTPKTAPRAPD